MALLWGICPRAFPSSTNCFALFHQLFVSGESLWFEPGNWDSSAVVFPPGRRTAASFRFESFLPGWDSGTCSGGLRRGASASACSWTRPSSTTNPSPSLAQ